MDFVRPTVSEVNLLSRFKFAGVSLFWREIKRRSREIFGIGVKRRSAWRTSRQPHKTDLELLNKIYMRCHL
jgi:hypothetical protein